MANQRPIRAPRGRWRRGRRRPVRWIDALSAPLVFSELGNAEPGALGGGSIFPAGFGVTAGDLYSVSYRELIVGDIDTEWADANEVVLERLVGDIHVRGVESVGVPPEDTIISHWNELSTLVRMGIVLIEDVDEQTATDQKPPSLWSADDLADGEWLWLWQLGSPQENHVYIDETDEVVQRVWCHDYHLDLRVKRKLGRRDRLVLCHEFAVPAPTLVGTHSVSVYPLLRQLVSSK